MKESMKKTRKYALLAGISLLIMALLAGYSFGFVMNSIYVENDPITTAANIASSNLLYLSGNLGWVLILIADVLVAIGFYMVLKHINKKMAILSASFRLLYSAIFAIGIANLFWNNIEAFMKFWSLGLFVIGFHLIFTGIATFYTKQIPFIIGLLLIIAGTGYSLIHGIYNFLPAYTELGTTIESIMGLPMTIGELTFGFWLIIKGGKSNQPASDAELADVA